MSQSNRQSKFSRLRVAVLAAVVVAGLGAGSRVEATTIVPMDAAELSDRAELVFTGTAVQTRVVRSKDGEPYTFVTFAVHDLLKGWTMERQIDLRFSGGETEGGVVSFEGMPQFEKGKSYLLFVQGNGTLLCPVLGWWQGQYRFDREPGSGKQILVDSEGAQLRGVSQGRFQRAERAERLAADAGMTVVSEEGVHVELPQRAQKGSVTANAVSGETPATAQIIGQLRSLISARSTAGTFVPGRRVDSARPEDLPVRRAVSAVNPH
jgi:hypothetical protein